MPVEVQGVAADLRTIRELERAHRPALERGLADLRIEPRPRIAQLHGHPPEIAVVVPDHPQPVADCARSSAAEDAA